MVFLMAAGGTGGHVLPALAVARELRARGHQVLFVGTRKGLECRLAPVEGFAVECIEIGALKRVGWVRQVRTLWQLPLSTLRAMGLLKRCGAAAVFSMGGYVAGPVCLAAWLRGTPLVVMEPNVVPGFTNRWAGKVARRVLLNFPETATFFSAGKCEVTGVPVREEFFRLPPKPPGEFFDVLVTGGSQGSRRLNEAVRQSWPLFRAGPVRVRITLQTGPAAYAELVREFAQAGIPGRVTAFIDDMPGAFAQADLVVCRAGAGTVAELAAAGKPALLVPFPYAADDHQLRNAEALVRAGAARMVLDHELTGERLYREVMELASEPERLASMGRAARKFARPGAAQRVAQVLIEEARKGLDRDIGEVEQ